MTITYFIIFIYGITIGSFLNVCIYRLPLNEEIVHSSSHCMSCGYTLRWYDLIPLFSWLFLRGRCRSCGERISIQYPLVELANGLIWVGLIHTQGLTITGVCYCIAASSLIVLSVIDWRTYEIPAGCSFVILLSGFLNMAAHGEQWLPFMIGFSCISGFLLLILLASRGRAMGGGDVKLMASAGLLLGWQQIIFAFFIGCVLASVIHLILMKIKGKGHMLAFGPYLSLGIWFSMMWGEGLVEWYIRQLAG